MAFSEVNAISPTEPTKPIQPFWSKAVDLSRALAASSIEGSLKTSFQAPEVKRKSLNLGALELHIIAVKEVKKENQHLIPGELVSWARRERQTVGLRDRWPTVGAQTNYLEVFSENFKRTPQGPHQDGAPRLQEMRTTGLFDPLQVSDAHPATSAKGSEVGGLKGPVQEFPLTQVPLDGEGLALLCCAMLSSWCKSDGPSLWHQVAIHFGVLPTRTSSLPEASFGA